MAVQTQERSPGWDRGSGGLQKTDLRVGPVGRLGRWTATHLRLVLTA